MKRRRYRAGLVELMVKAMPSKSKAQARMMAAAAHNPEFAKKVGVPVAVARDFNQADKGKRLAEAMKKMEKK